MGTFRPRMLRVDHSELRELCTALAAEVVDFNPDLVVGIATGGADIARHVAEMLGSPRVVVVRSQRPGTKVKQNPLLSKALRSLPERVAYLARWLEVEHREGSFYVTNPARRRALHSLGNAIEHPGRLIRAATGAHRVLVVDDTVDSGVTLIGVMTAVRAIAPDAEVRSAVVATTWRRPPIDPDYVIHERLMLRLPSSFDAQPVG